MKFPRHQVQVSFSWCMRVFVRCNTLYYPIFFFPSSLEIQIIEFWFLALVLRREKKKILLSSRYLELTGKNLTSFDRQFTFICWVLLVLHGSSCYKCMCMYCVHKALDQIKIHFANTHTHARKQTTIYSKTNTYTVCTILYTRLQPVNCQRLRKYLIILEIRRDVNGVVVSCSIAPRMLSHRENISVFRCSFSAPMNVQWVWFLSN